LDASAIAVIGAVCTVAARTVAKKDANVARNPKLRSAETSI
jgi:hypothetical protein